MRFFQQKKAIAALMLGAAAAILAVVVTSCVRNYATEGNHPADTLAQFLEYVSDGDLSSVMKMTGTETDVSSSDSGRVEKRLLEVITQNTSVTGYQELRIEGKRAWTTLGILHPDAALIMRQAVPGVIEETKEYEWKHGSYKTDEEISQAIEESLLRQLEGNLINTMITDRIRVEFRFTEDKKWVLVMSDELFNALTGNLSQAGESIDGYFEEYKARKAG